MKYNPLISHFYVLFLVFIFIGIRWHNLIICNGDSNSVYCNFHILSTFSIDIFEIKRLSTEKVNKINWLNTKVATIQKPVNWLALQINWLVSIWWQFRRLLNWLTYKILVKNKFHESLWIRKLNTDITIF